MWGSSGTPHNFLLAFIDEFWKTGKIRLLKKWKNLLHVSSFYVCVPKTTIIWGTVPEIRSETEFFVILGHFWPFQPPLPLTTHYTKILKNEKIIWRCHSKLVQHKNTIWCIFTQIWSACTDIIFFHFRLFSALLPHY